VNSFPIEPDRRPRYALFTHSGESIVHYHKVGDSLSLCGRREVAGAYFDYDQTSRLDRVKCDRCESILGALEKQARQ
jgi:hypothetical protein